MKTLGYECEFGQVTAVKRYIIFYRGPAGKSTKNRPLETPFLVLLPWREEEVEEGECSLSFMHG